MSLMPSLDPEEEILIHCPVAYKLRSPLGITPVEKACYLTESRLIIEKECDYAYIPYAYLTGLNLVGSHDAEKVIKLEHGKKIRFAVHGKESLHIRNQKTEKLYNWLHDLCNSPDKKSSVLRDIKAARRQFEPRD